MSEKRHLSKVGFLKLIIALVYHYPSPSMLGLLNCIMSVGSLCALPVVPYSADLLGRRTSIIIGCSIMVLGVLLQTLGFTYGMFVGARQVLFSIVRIRVFLQSRKPNSCLKS